uniref:Homeobox domain-containing protein n=1 Tax=Timema poppense TaxID=170557 RepID=A0A7R9H0T5_TIMPO|nr:unnamed protein product [Timema poppensis]
MPHPHSRRDESRKPECENVAGVLASPSLVSPQLRSGLCRSLVSESKVSRRPNGCPRRRGRQTYTRFQTLELEKEFHFNHYLTRRRRIEIAHALFEDAASKKY